jgi:Trk-type K+ transport system membrane component
MIKVLILNLYIYLHLIYSKTFLDFLLDFTKFKVFLIFLKLIFIFLSIFLEKKLKAKESNKSKPLKKIKLKHLKLHNYKKILNR